MKILHQNNIGFAISETGEITCSSTWELIADSIDEWVDFAAAARDWAVIGNHWRQPDDDSQGYTDDADYVITSVDLTAKSRWIYDVQLKGRKRDLVARMTDYSEETNNKDEKTKTATWSIAAESLDGFLPAIGDVLDWAGEFYYCDNISSKKVGILEGRYEVTITAIDLSTVMLGNPSFSRNEKYESTKSATWKVSNSAYEAFIEAHDVNSDASNWAENGYYVTSIKAEPRGKLGYDISVEAKHIAVRCLDVNREDNFKGYDVSGNNVKEIKYTGKWQVHKDNIGDFDNLAGASAKDWAEEGYIVSRVSRSQVNDMEYEYSLEAYNPDDVSSSVNLGEMQDDRSKLSARIDVNPGTREIILTEKQCGWIKEKPFKTGNSGILTTEDAPEIWKPIVRTRMYDLVADEDKSFVWKASRDCPFTLTNDNGYLDIKYAKPIQCICLEYTKYSKGDPGTQLGEMRTRMNVMGQKIGTQTINGLNANWKRTSYNVEKVLDNKGDAWWKESFVLLAAPNGWTWSAAYHEGQI